MVLLEVKNLSVERNGKLLFENLNFSLREGEKVFVTGPNGGGKTTLVETIMGFVKPLKGEIYFSGKKVETEEDFYKLRTSVGYVFQNPDEQLFSPTVEEELAFAPLNLGLSRREVKDRINRVLKQFKIEHLKERITFQLSGGEKRIVSIACVLTMEPRALILDEPTNALDGVHFTRLVEFLKNTDKGLVVITHDDRLLKTFPWKVYKLSARKLSIAKE
jgi:cobalt/nickel transport system ATP-binding protein